MRYQTATLALTLLFFCLLEQWGVLAQKREQRTVDIPPPPDPLEGLDDNIKREIKKNERRARDVQNARELIDNVLHVNEETLRDLIDTTEYLFIIFYDPEIQGGEPETLKEMMAEALSAKNEAKVVFVNVKAEEELAKKEHVRYTPLIKVFVAGVPVTAIPKEVPLTPDLMIAVTVNMNLDPKRWTPKTSNALKDFVKHYHQYDQFHMICLCEKTSREYDLVRIFGGIPNGGHDVHQLDPNDQASRNISEASPEPLNQIVLVNKYLEKKIRVPEESLGSVRQLYEFLEANKWAPVNNLFSKSAEELNQETNTFLALFVPREQNETVPGYLDMLNRLAETPEIKGKMNLFLINTIDRFATQMGIKMSKKTHLFIVENGYSWIYMNSFEMPSSTPITFENVLSFYKDYENDTIPKVYASEKKPPKEFRGIPLVLTRDNYFEILENPEKDTLVAYYKECVGKDCFPLLETMKTVMKRMENNPRIQFAVMDLKKNDMSDIVRVGTAVHFVLHPGKNPRRMKGWGNRPSKFIEEALILFIMENTSQEWVEPLPRIKGEL